jgi:DNA polymerase III epsilon subunit-like protein
MIFFFDTETTGLSRQTDHIVQVAWAVTSFDGRLINEDCRIIRPSGYEIPSAATRIHGISTEHAQTHGEDLDGVLSRFAADAAKARVVVAHNISFDLGMLTSAFGRAKLAFPMESANQICTMRSSTSWCRLPHARGGNGYKWPKLEELHAKLFGHEFEGAHNALADVQATRRCFFRLIELGAIPPV